MEKIPDKAPLLAILLFLLYVAGYDLIQLSELAKASHGSGAHLMIMWDGSSTAPTGWSYVSDSGGDLYQKMPRGAATYGGTGGSDTHSPTVTYVSETAGATTNIDAVGTAFSDGNAHSHGSFSVSSVDTQTSLPRVSTLRFIEYNSGIPTQIPSGGIVMFDATVPSGFTRYSAQDGFFIRGDSSAGNVLGAGSNTHITTIALAAEGGAGRGNVLAGPTRAATVGHGHSGALGSTDDISHDPLNVQVILGQANTDVNLPNGMIGMFDATVSSPWNTLSGSGGVFENRYIQANSTYSTGLGASSHTHANQAITSGLTTGNNTADTSPAVFPGASLGHTHSVTVSYSSSNNAPAYVDVIVAKYDPAYTPTTKNWRWFDAEDVANPNTTNGGTTTNGQSMANENTAPANARVIYKLNAMKLRVVIGETGGLGATDVKYWLQYAYIPNFSDAVDVGNQGSTTEEYRYYDGANVADDDSITTTRLTGSPTAGRHNEDKTTGGGVGGGSTFDPSASTDYEHEFTIQNYAHDLNKPIYFRVRYCATSTSSCTASTVALGSGQTAISLVSSSAYDLEMAQAPGDVNLGTVVNSNNTHQYIFQAGEEIAFWDKRGTLAAYDVTVGSLTMTCCSGGDTIPGSDITWTSTTGVLNSAYASSSTGFTGNTGQTLNITRNAYSSASSTDLSRRGGFFYLPTLNFTNLNTADPGNYTGTLTITIL